MLRIKFRKYLTMTNCMYVLVFLVGTLLSYHFYFGGAVNIRFSDERRSHVARTLSDTDLAQLAGLTNQSYFDEALEKILVPRVVGNISHERVKEYISSELESIGLTVEYDSFEDVTPTFGLLSFTNIIGRLDPGAERFLALACHYDSKYFSQFDFLGATDSAVPCAILLHLARVLAPYLRNTSSDVSLMLIFFDGEEAFENWSPTDSIYGARNLADRWSQLESVGRRTGRRATHLQRMDMLVLLDLLGTKDSKFYSFFTETERWHGLLAQSERRLKAAELIPREQPQHFLEKSAYNTIEDDHLPFLSKDVPVLHVIPLQFPEVWHTAMDNYSALDFPTIHTLNKVLQVFTFAYLTGGTPLEGTA